MRRKIIYLLAIACVFSACNPAVSDSKSASDSKSVSDPAKVADFESCVAAGNKILRSYPPKCVAPGAGTFTQSSRVAVDEIKDNQPPPEVADPLEYRPACKDNCGNGICDEMVCMAVGCPCSETAASCPNDCH